MKLRKIPLILTVIGMLFFTGLGVNAGTETDEKITVHYDLNGGRDKTTGAEGYSKEYIRDGAYGIDLYYPDNIENGDLVFLGWKRSDKFNNPNAKIYCETGVYSSFTYRNSYYSYIQDGYTFKALWGKKITLTLKSGKEHKFKDLEGNYVDTLEIGWFNELPYDFRFSLMTMYSPMIYNGDNMPEDLLWMTNNYYSSEDKDYCLTAFKSTKTGEVYDLIDYDFDPTGDETFEAVWTKTVKIDEDYNGGEFLLYGARKQAQTDIVPAGRKYYVFYNSPYINFDFTGRDDKEIIKPGYKLAGWKSSADGKVYKQNDAFTPEKDTLFTAVWEKCAEGEDESASKVYGLTTVRYDANGGEFKDSFNARLLSDEDKSMRAFYGNMMISEYKTEKDTLVSVVKDVKLPVGYFVGDSKLFYEPYDDEKYASKEEYKAKVLDKLPMREAFVVEKEGYVLEGWTVKSDDSGKVYKVGDIIDLPATDITFEAKWKEFVPTATPTPTVTPAVTSPAATGVPTAAPTGAAASPAVTAAPTVTTDPKATTAPTEYPIITVTVTPTVDPSYKYINGVDYNITSEKKRTVTYSSRFNCGTSLTIPSTVKIGKVKYKVTKIAAGAFKGNKKLKKVVIGKNIVSIGKEAFSGCSNLKKITVKSAVLKKVGKNAFNGVHKKAKMTLLKKSQKKLFKKSAYKGKYLIKKKKS